MKDFADIIKSINRYVSTSYRIFFNAVLYTLAYELLIPRDTDGPSDYSGAFLTIKNDIQADNKFSGFDQKLHKIHRLNNFL